jgi:hypothetical protein
MYTIADNKMQTGSKRFVETHLMVIEQVMHYST